MKSGPVITFVALAALALGAGGTWFAMRTIDRLQHETDDEEHEPGEPTGGEAAAISVRVARAVRGSIVPEIAGFGMVEADPRDTSIVSAPL